MINGSTVEKEKLGTVSDMAAIECKLLRQEVLYFILLKIQCSSSTLCLGCCNALGQKLTDGFSLYSVHYVMHQYLSLLVFLWLNQLWIFNFSVICSLFFFFPLGSFCDSYCVLFWFSLSSYTPPLFLSGWSLWAFQRDTHKDWKG